MGPSDLKTGRNELISYTMIVSGCLKTFLVILDFFGSDRALATLCKLENLEIWQCLPIFCNFLSKIGEIAHFGGQFFGRKIDLNRPISVGKSIFWTF